MKRPEMAYLYRGRIERWSASRRCYVWRAGFSAEGPSGPLYPWSTRNECQSEAARDGFKAVFYFPE